MRVRPRRRGYAMVAVVAFVLIFLGLWTVAARQINTMLRVEQARHNRILADQANLAARQALAQALAALGSGYPPSSPYYCRYGSDFEIAFTNPDPADYTAWTVTVSPSPDLSLPALDPFLFHP